MTQDRWNKYVCKGNVNMEKVKENLNKSLWSKYTFKDNVYMKKTKESWDKLLFQPEYFESVHLHFIALNNITLHIHMGGKKG